MNLDRWQAMLECVRSYRFGSTTNAHAGWEGQGAGTVNVESAGEGVLLFHEEGRFENANGVHRSRNLYRWTLKPDEGLISLEHLRFGPSQPVFLFDLALGADGIWRSQCPHLCDTDQYHAEMASIPAGFELKWRITQGDRVTSIQYAYLT